MNDEWSLGPKMHGEDVVLPPEPAQRRRATKTHTAFQEETQAQTIPHLIEMIQALTARAEDHYMMISGQLDHLRLELDAHTTGPYAAPGGHIINRLVKPDPRLADDLNSGTQFRLLTWLYRLHDPRLERSVATQRALDTLCGNAAKRLP